MYVYNFETVYETVCTNFETVCTILIPFIPVASLADSSMWLDAITQNAWDTGLYIGIICS